MESEVSIKGHIAHIPQKEREFGNVNMSPKLLLFNYHKSHVV